MPEIASYLRSQGLDASSALPLLEAIERLHEAFVITDAVLDEPGPRFLFANQAFLDMTGYSREDLEGKTPRILQGPDTDRGTIRRLRTCLETGTVFKGETENYRKDGSVFTMRWYIEPIRDRAGRILFFFAIQRDVTAEIEANQQRLSLAKAISQLEEVVVLFDRDGFVRLTNAAYGQWQNDAAADVVGQRIWRIYGAPERAGILRDARQTLGRGMAWQGEFTVRSRMFPDERRILSVSVSPVRDDEQEDEILQFVAIGRDITERRRLESVVQAHNLHDNLGFVFSGIRHELGNPVNSLKAALQLILGGFETMPATKLYDYLGRMEKELERVEYLLRSLRSYSLYDLPRCIDLDLREFLAGFGRLAETDLQEREVQVQIDVGRKVDTVWADPQALHQVLLNLIQNAVTAIADRSDGWVQIRARSRRNQVFLFVQDNGSGISPEQLDRLFTPFYTNRPGGTGLGLTICRHLMSIMGGSIDIKSSSEGTEARLILDSRPRR